MQTISNDITLMETFLEAIEADDVGIVRQFIVENKAEVNTLLDESSILGHAALHGSLMTVKFLVAAGAAANLPFEEYYDIDPPLLDAIEDGNLEIIRFLVESGADVNAVRGERCALGIAALSGLEDIYSFLLPLTHPSLVKQAEELLPEGHNYKQKREALSKKEKQLFESVRRTDLKNLEQLISQKVNVNIIDERGYTPLMYAVEKGKFSSTQILLNAGADPNFVARTIILAVGSNDPSFIQLLIKAGVDLNIQCNGMNVFTPIVNLPHKYCKEIIELLLKAGANIDQRDDYGNSLLMLATYKGREDIIQILMNNGASKYHLKNIELLMAAEKGNLDQVIDLLHSESKLDINAQEFRGRSVLTCAVIGKHTEVVKTLITNGADINLIDSQGRTPLMWAISTGNMTVIDYIIQAGADISIESKDGETTLDGVKYNCPVKPNDRKKLIQVLSFRNNYK